MDEAVLDTGGAAALEMAASAALERGEKIAPCRNCGAPVLGVYCGECGQPVETHRRSVLHLLHDLVKDIASWDSRILRTARALFLQPGELALAFREGRTQRYVPPVRLYLFVSLVFFLILSATHVAILQLELITATKRTFTDAGGQVLEEKNGKTTVLENLKTDKNGIVVAGPQDDGDHPDLIGTRPDGSTKTNLDVTPHFFTRAGTADHPVSPELRKILDRDERLIDGALGGGRFKLAMNGDPKRILETLATNPAAINGPLTEWIPRVLFVLLPAFAVLLAALYWRQRRDFYFVDHLVFSLNAFSFAFVAILLAIGLARFVSGGTAVFAALCATSLHLLLSMKRFYRQGWGWTGLKFAFVSFIYGVFFVGPALIGIILAALVNLS
jgi:hypothetical protein